MEDRLEIEIVGSEDKEFPVEICIPTKWSFEQLMMACEYLMTITASKSKAGFERALELLCKGATTYRTRR